MAQIVGQLPVCGRGSLTGHGRLTWKSAHYTPHSEAKYMKTSSCFSNETQEAEKVYDKLLSGYIRIVNTYPSTESFRFEYSLSLAFQGVRPPFSRRKCVLEVWFNPNVEALFSRFRLFICWLITVWFVVDNPCFCSSLFELSRGIYSIDFWSTLELMFKYMFFTPSWVSQILDHWSCADPSCSGEHQAILGSIHLST